MMISSPPVLGVLKWKYIYFDGLETLQKHRADPSLHKFAMAVRRDHFGLE